MIHSAAGAPLPSAGLVTRPPFRAPHHTSSIGALVGGGGHQHRPGEISLAHNGVLFLDEMPEFDRRVLEVLREPLESGQITISRAAHQAEFPASFQLIAAMNPCPCGHLGDNGNSSCRCTADQVSRYRGRLSGPLLDRIDIHINVPRVPPESLQLRPTATEERSSSVRQRVERARKRQLARSGCANALLDTDAVRQHCSPQPSANRMMQRAMEQLGLSARAYHRILKLARTIADLAGSNNIETAHISEAIGYRQLDRQR
jgi:magnesium chelatase family protein